MKKIWFIFLLCGMVLTTHIGCSSSDDEKPLTVDTAAVVRFTDERIASHNYTIIERTVSQRTNDTSRFIVEYLCAKGDGKDAVKYGYYLQSEGDSFVVISEGEDVNTSIF
jgi:dihydroxyacetone kinase-like predicted kinase